MSTLEDLIRALKGGAGSGNWGHSGRPGSRGGSAPKTGLGAAMSIRSGPTAVERQQAAKLAAKPNKLHSVEFSSQQTYSGQKRVSVKAREGDSPYGTEVMQIRKTGEGAKAWALYMPDVYAYVGAGGERKPGQYISGKRTLRDAKKLATDIINAAPNRDSIEALREATVKPDWLKDIK